MTNTAASASTTVGQRPRSKRFILVLGVVGISLCFNEYIKYTYVSVMTSSILSANDSTEWYMNYFNNGTGAILPISKVEPEIKEEPKQVVVNSERWLQGPRLGNVQDLPDDLIKELIYHNNAESKNARLLLEQSICTKESRFLNFDLDYEESESEMQMSDLVFRVMYLTLHDHQHKHARAEALQRYSDPSTTSTLLNENKIGNFDYECPDAKFIVSTVPEHGLGVSIRLGVIDSLILGVSLDRVTLLHNSIPVGNRYFKRKWKLASCDRQDLQCFFQPMSPCVLTEEDVANAPQVSVEELNEFRKTGVLDPKYDNERVIVVGADTGGYKNIPSIYRQKMADIMSTMNLEGMGLDETAITSIKDNMLDESIERWRLDDAVMFYILRPNLAAKERMDELVNGVTPEDFNPDRALGIPVRGSDKCNRESECLTFPNYMGIAQQFLKKGEYDTIVLTSESLPVLQARFDYNQNETFPFRFIANDEDVTQNTGAPGGFSVAADEVMLSTMTAVKLQLLTGATVGNCCSNFHKMMASFLARGCGSARKNYFECLQDNENEEYRLCCAWTNTAFCREKRRKKQG